MPIPSKRVQIFIASPGDVQFERDQLSKVINELNLTISAIAPEKAIVLELIRWETHVHPGLGRDAQDVINQQVGSFDIFIGIMWKRFGTPTHAAESGTEEEFNRAYAVWERNKTLPVLFYFCQAPFAPPKTNEDVEQLGKVTSFRTALSQTGLVWEYADHSSFSDVIRPHLILVLSKMFSSKESHMEAAEHVGRLTPESDKTIVRQQVSSLAQEYEQLRKRMPSGDPRTREMTRIASEMRALALASYPLLPELIRSSSPGERLAAVATLMEIPTSGCLKWLADRLGVEKPFIGYQASLALLAAVRKLGYDSHDKDLENAIERGTAALEGMAYKDPNQVHVLAIASQELQKIRIYRDL